MKDKEKVQPPEFSPEELELIMNSCNHWVDTLGYKFGKKQVDMRHEITSKIRNYFWKMHINQ